MATVNDPNIRTDFINSSKVVVENGHLFIYFLGKYIIYFGNSRVRTLALVERNLLILPPANLNYLNIIFFSF